MENILVLTDFSSVADNAAHYAVKLAETLRAKIIFFNAYLPEGALAAAEHKEDANEPFDTRSEIKLKALIKKLNAGMKKSAFFKPTLNYLTKPGTLKDCIHAINREHQIDLIIMGAHQYNDLNNFLCGGNVKGVMDKAQCPLLLIPENAEFKTIKNIFYATDLRYCDLQVIKFLENLARPLQASVSLLHVCAEGLPELLAGEAMDMFQDMVSPQIKYRPMIYNGIESKDAELFINDSIEKQELDILSVAYRKHHFFKRIFQSCVTQKNDAYLHIPLMVVPLN
jgi:nucleotide-binding universal stress UspA family protein